MPVTRVGNTFDNYIQSTGTTYASARDGTGTKTLASATANVVNAGQYKGTSATDYRVYQNFENWDLTALTAGQLLVSAEMVRVFRLIGGTISRNLEVREFDYGASFGTDDWRTPAQFAATPRIVEIDGITSSTVGYRIYSTGSETLHTKVAAATDYKCVICTSRFRNSQTPTTQEHVALFSRDEVTYGVPTISYATLMDNRLARLGGASVQISDGTTVFVLWDGSTLKLHYSTDGTTEVEIGELQIGDPADQRVDVDIVAMQTVSLTVDEDDNIWVAAKEGRDTFGENNLYIQNWNYNGGHSWSVGVRRRVAAPAFGSDNASVPINNVAVQWHKTSNDGHLMVVLSHRAGKGKTGQISWLSISCNNIINLSFGPWIADSGTNPPWLGLTVPTGQGDRQANDMGNCLDVWGDATAAAPVGYTISMDGSFSASSTSGSGRVAFGRYGLDNLGQLIKSQAFGGVSVTSPSPETRAKIVPIAGDKLAFCVGGKIEVYNTAGTRLGGADYEDLDSVDLMANNAVDYIYDPVTNKVWLYYIDPAVATRTIKRNGFAIDTFTFQAKGSETTVSAAVGAVGSTNPVIRLPRGRVNERIIRIDVANITSGGTHSNVDLLDSFNIAPSAPLLQTQENFDATGPTTFKWTFVDPNTMDSQTAYQLRIYDVADDSLDFDSSKQVSTNKQHTVPGGSLANSKSYYWTVRTWDIADATGADSTQGTFQTTTTAVTTITAPATDNPDDADGSRYLVQWTTTVITQAKYRVILVNAQTGATIINTGFVTSTDQEYQLTSLDNGTIYRVEVTVRDAVDIEAATGIRFITPSYSQPPVPTVEAVPNEDGGYIEVSVTNPEPGFDESETSWNDIFRAEGGSNEFTRITSIGPNATYLDYNVRSDRDYRYYCEAIRG